MLSNQIPARKPRAIERKPRVVIKRSDLTKFIRWLTDNQPMLDQEKFTLKQAWQRATKEIGIDCSCESFRRLVRDSGIQWASPQRGMGKISGDKYRFLAQIIKRLAKQQQEIVLALNDCGYQITDSNINIEALHRLTRGQSWREIKEVMEDGEEIENSPISPKG